MSDEITGNSVEAAAAPSIEPGAAPDGHADASKDAAPLEDAAPTEVFEDTAAADAGGVDHADGAEEAEDAEDVEEDPVDAVVVAPAEPEAPSTPEKRDGAVKPAGAKAEGKANGSGGKSEQKANGSGGKSEQKVNGSGGKSEQKVNGSKPKKSKKKSQKAKSRDDEHAGSLKPLPSGAASEGASAPGDNEKPAGGRRERIRRVLVDNFLAVILAVVAVGLAVALALTTLQVGNDNTVGSARASALGAARTYAAELAGYDYRHLDQDFGIVLAHSTPSFRRSFTQSSDALKSTLLKYHASAKATVVAAGLVSASTGRAVALVFLDQTVTNSTQKRPTADRSQLEITLVRAGGTWLIDQVTLL
jgi:Mce-associated membrane protein